MASISELVGVEALPPYLESLAFNSAGQMALVASNLTGRLWSGAIAVFNDPDMAPNLPHLSYGCRHDAGCTDVSWLGENKLAVATDAGTIEIYELDGNPLLHNLFYLAEHSDVCSSITISENKLQLVSGSWDYVIKIWDVAVDMSIHTIRMHTDKVLDVEFSPASSDLFASASEDGTVKLYDNRQDKPALTVSHDPTYFPACLAWGVSNDALLYSGHCNGLVKCVDVRTPMTVTAQRRMHDKCVNRIVAHPSDSTLIASCADDMHVKFTSAISNNAHEEKACHEDFAQLYISPKGSHYAKGLAFNPADGCFWSCSWDEKVDKHKVPAAAEE